MVTFDEKEFVRICNESKTMAQAARLCNMHYNTFKRYAVKLGCFYPNPSGKGLKKENRRKFKTEDILNGEHPDYPTYKLKLRLFRENRKEDKCEICGWNKKREGKEFSPCELHHIDGNPRNHDFKNLILLCPNCHSLMDHYRSKNRASN